MSSCPLLMSSYMSAMSSCPLNLSSYPLTMYSYPLLMSSYMSAMSSCPLNLSSYPSSSMLPLLSNTLLSPVLFVTLVFLSVFVCVCDSYVILDSTWHHSPQVVDTPSMVSNIGRGSHSIGVSSVGYWGSIGNRGYSMNIGLSSNFFMDIG